MKAIITLKFPRNYEHDPKNKLTGVCPLSYTCTDTTGEHHCYEESGEDMNEIMLKARNQAKQVGAWGITRIEVIYK